MRPFHRFWHLFSIPAVLLLGAAGALAEADGPDFYRVVDVAADDVLNIRAGPGATYQIVGRIPAGADGIVNFTACVGGLGSPEWERATAEQRVAARDRLWCRIGYDRIIGWSAGRFLGEGAGPDAFRCGGRLASLAGSEWQVRDFTGAPVDGEAWIAFKGDGKAIGHSGCNRFNASYAESPGQIEISPLAMTRMACPPALMELEAALVKALDAADGMMASQLVLAIFDRDGLLQVTLTRRDAD
ncbi:MAG: META domain-containing protein [Hyphomicrobiales bacterium]|nr:META domain-containing protein [Hyphomicrobiales bacterium]